MENQEFLNFISITIPRYFDAEFEINSIEKFKNIGTKLQSEKLSSHQQFFFQNLLKTFSSQNSTVVNQKTKSAQKQKKNAILQQTLILGYSSSSLGFAFLSGYQSACETLISSLILENNFLNQNKKNEMKLLALCATEKVAGAPLNSIETKLTKRDENSFFLNGQKSFITCGKQADYLLVYCLLEEKENNNKKTKFIIIPSNLENIKFQETEKKISIIPEIPHASVTFQNVVVYEQNVLPGNGFLDYLKNFRIIEDIYVFLGILSYIWKLIVSFEGSVYLKERILNFFSNLYFCNELDFKEANSQIVIFSAIETMVEFLQKDEFQNFLNEKVPKEITENFHRDFNITNVASRIRQRKKEKAFKSFQSKL